MEEVRNNNVNESAHALVVDGEADLASDETRQTFAVVNYVFICTIVSLFGLTTNAVNMVVFCKQRFKNTMTISFMALAISDMGSLITLLWFGLCMNPLLIKMSDNVAFFEIQALTASCPHITFGRITDWITTYITAERCLCIAAPLAVKNILTPKRTTCSLVIIFAINIIIVLPYYTTSYIGWKFLPDLNRTIIGLIKTSDYAQTEAFVFLLHAVLIITAFVCVTLLTCVLVVKLKIASKWRRQATQGKAQSEAMSTKDKKATSMVVMISGLLIAMNCPGILLSLTSFAEPRFGVFGTYQNLFFVIWSFGFVCHSINSSVNIFLYYNMSSKYREIFNGIFLKQNTKIDACS